MILFANIHLNGHHIDAGQRARLSSFAATVTATLQLSLHHLTIDSATCKIFRKSRSFLLNAGAFASRYFGQNKWPKCM